MNVILSFPTKLAAELLQLRQAVESHRLAIEVGVRALEPQHTVWKNRDLEIAGWLNAIRQRLAALPA